MDLCRLPLICEWNVCISDGDGLFMRKVLNIVDCTTVVCGDQTI